jgi:hypothetical protein
VYSYDDINAEGDFEQNEEEGFIEYASNVATVLSFGGACQKEQQLVQVD